jgi:hypothetical protein
VSSSTSAAATGRRALRGGLAGALLLSSAAGVWWFGFRSPAPGPGEPETPASTAGLIGAQRCAECHAEQATAHALSGHSRTFAATHDSAVAQALCGQSVPAFGHYGRFEYECDDEGLMVGVTERFGGRLFPLEYAFGSGDHAVTFLSILSNREGETVGIEHRCTWYPSRGGLGITPGQDDLLPEREIEEFGRMYDETVVRRCVGCHTTTFDLRDHKVHDVVAGVQCEACHGPGKEHAEAAARGDVAAAQREIGRPRTADEEIALCGRCHRMPHEFPEERLSRYPPSLRRFQPVGLLRSRCYLDSHGELRCSTCHDPHETVKARSPERQEADCKSCHAPGRSAECSVSKETGCIDCHMQRLELIPGIFFRDHWIRRNPAADPPVTDDSGAAHQTGDHALP